MEDEAVLGRVALGLERAEERLLRAWFGFGSGLRIGVKGSRVKVRVRARTGVGVRVRARVRVGVRVRVRVRVEPPKTEIARAEYERPTDGRDTPGLG